MPLICKLDAPFIDRHKDAIKFSALLQLGVILLASVMLDGGVLLKVVLLGAIAYWCSLAIIMVRRDMNDTKCDCVLLRWGFLVMLTIALLMFGAVIRS